MRSSIANAVIAGVVAFALGSAAEVVASDLGGEWVGKVRCKATDGVRRSVPDRGANVRISQLGRKLSVRVEDSQGLRHYNGELVRQIGREQRIEAVLIECRTATALSNYSEKVMLRGTVLPASAKLSGESFFRNQWGEIGTCRWRLQRLNSKVVNVAPCN